MANKLYGDLMFSSGTYKDQDGNEKKRWNKAGVVFESDDGRLSIKLEAVPVSPEWSGWLSVFKKDDGFAKKEYAQSHEFNKQITKDVVIDDIDDSPIDLSDLNF